MPRALAKVEVVAHRQIFVAPLLRVLFKAVRAGVRHLLALRCSKVVAGKGALPLLGTSVQVFIRLPRVVLFGTK